MENFYNILTTSIVWILRFFDFCMNGLLKLYAPYFEYIIANPFSPLALFATFLLPLLTLMEVKTDIRPTKTKEAIYAALLFTGGWSVVFWCIGVFNR